MEEFPFNNVLKKFKDSDEIPGEIPAEMACEILARISRKFTARNSRRISAEIPEEIRSEIPQYPSFQYQETFMKEYHVEKLEESQKEEIH